MNYGMVITAVAVVAVASVAGVIFIDPTTPDEEVTVEMVMGSDTQTVKVDKGAYVDSLPEVTAPPGMSFMGWYSSLDSMSAYGADTPINANCVLYALFANTAPGFDTNREHHVVQFKYNIRDVQPTYIAVNHNEPVSFPDVAENVGVYTFAGWYTDTSFQPSSIYIDDVPVRSDMTLYGYYSSVTYNVSFDSSGGRVISGYEARLDVMEGQTLDGAWGGSFPTIMEKDGFIFSHWQTSDGDAWDTSRDVISGNTVLKAVWAEKKVVSSDSAMVDEGDRYIDTYGNEIIVHIARIDDIVYSMMSDVFRGHDGPLTIQAQWTEARCNSIENTLTTIESHTSGSSDSHGGNITAGIEVGNFVKGSLSHEWNWNHELFEETTRSEEHSTAVSESLSNTFGTSVSYGFDHASSSRYYAIVLLSTADVFEKITVYNDGSFTTEVIILFTEPTISARSSSTTDFSNLATDYSLLSADRVREYVDEYRESHAPVSYCNIRYHVGDDVHSIPKNAKEKIDHKTVAGSFATDKTVFGWSTLNPINKNFSLQNVVTSNVQSNLSEGNLDIYVITIPKDCSSYTPIATHSDLLEINKSLSGKYVLIRDINLDGKNWTPIAMNSSGDGNKVFKGIINGNGHTLSNFTIDKGYESGFIGINSGTIKDLHLRNVTMSYNSSYSSGIYLGFLAGRNWGTIDGCSVSNSSMDVKTWGTDKTMRLSIGSIAGLNTTNRTISNCYATYNTFKIESNSTDRAENGNGSTIIFGGIAGYVRGTIADCYTKSINASAKAISNVNLGTHWIGGVYMPRQNIYMGGIAGQLSNESGTVVKLENCYTNTSSNSLKANSDPGTYGNIWGTGPGTDNLHKYVGGVVGKRDSNAGSATILISNTYCDGGTKVGNGSDAGISAKNGSTKLSDYAGLNSKYWVTGGYTPHLK